MDSKNNKSDVINIYIHENISNASKIKNFTTGNEVTNSTNKLKNITMDVTSSITKDGKLTNLTSSFSKDKIKVGEGFSKEMRPKPQLNTTLTVAPTKEIIPGNYTLTISAKYNKDITVSKIVDLEIKWQNCYVGVKLKYLSNNILFPF